MAATDPKPWEYPGYNPRGQGGFGDARDLGPNAAAMSTFYDPSKTQGDVSGYYYDYNNPALRTSQGGQQVSTQQAGITPGSSGDPTWNPSAIYTDPSSQFYQPPGGSSSGTSAAQQAYSSYPPDIGYSGGASTAANHAYAPQQQSGGTPQYFQGGGAAGTIGTYAPNVGTGGAYNPSAGGQPGGLQNNTWWGDPAQASLENAFQQYGQNFLNPTNTQQLNATNPYGQPLQGEALGRQAGALYGNSTNSQSNLAGLMQQLNQPSELAQNQGAITGKIGQAGNAQGYLGGALNSLGQPTALDQAAGGIAGNYNGATNSQGYLQQIGAQLGGPGALEQFAASSLAGSNPYYERLGQQGRAAIDQSAASRGAYGAGGSLAALGNYQGALDAANFQNQGQLQGSAQAAQQARLGLGGQLSQYADSSALARGNALQGLAQNQTSNRLQSTALGGQLSSAADTSALNQGNALSQLYQSMFGDRMQSAGLGIQGNQAADQSQIARLAGITNMVNNGDQTTLARLAGQGGLAGQADTQGLNALNSYFNQAGNAQQAGGQRVNSQLDRELQRAQIMSQLYGGFYGQGGQQSVEAGTGSANAGANAAQLAGQGQNSGYTNLLKIFGLAAG